MTTATKPQELSIKVTSIYEKIIIAFDEKKRHIWVEGGTAASKTWSILQFLYLLNAHTKTPLLTSLVSETVPHIKRGCLRDFQKILGGNYNEAKFNKTDLIYHFPNAIVEFFGADQSDKLRGARRDILFVNEANNITYDAFRELDARTRLLTIADWNPTGEFWFHENNLADGSDSCYIHATYKDALDVIAPEIIGNIEAMGDKDPNWWNIYGLGLLGKIEGLVYSRFEQVDELPMGAYFYGLDFGFASDPTVLVKNVILGDKLYSEEVFYDYSGLTNDQIARKMELAGVKREPVYPDPDEPKSAEELRKFGFNIIEAVKGKGSVEFGVQKVGQFYQYWTKDSLNCIKEQRNFRFIKDRQTGNLTDRTTHQFSHGLDARRYAVASYKGWRSSSPGIIKVGW